MISDDVRKRHDDVLLVDLRTRASAVGLVQLVVELRQANVLDQDAVQRIRDAVIDELLVGRTGTSAEDEYRDSVRARLDRLLGTSRD